MPGPNNNNMTPQSLAAGQPTKRSGRGRRAAPTRLRTALQLGVVVVAGGLLLFAILSANGVL